MPYCSNCGAKNEVTSKFCTSCGESIVSTNIENESSRTRQQEYVGTIRKCPACGEEIPTLSAFCPSCGHEIVSVKVNSSLKSFTDTVDECDRAIAAAPKSKRGWQSWSKGIRICWVIINILFIGFPLAVRFLISRIAFHFKPSLTTSEQRKTDAIENYTFPNDRESSLESLLFIKSKMDFLASEKVDRHTKHWADVWYVKAKQIKEKNSLISGDVKDFTADNAFSDIEKDYRRIQLKIRRGTILSALLVMTYVIAFCIWSYGGAIVSLFIIDKSSNVEMNDISSVQMKLSDYLPEMNYTKGSIKKNTQEELIFYLDGVKPEDYENLVDRFIEFGYNIDPDRSEVRFSAFQNQGYRILLNTNTGIRKNDVLYVELTAPHEISEIRWSYTEIAKTIPKPHSNMGWVDYDSESLFRVYIANTDKDAYLDYIDECVKKGFNKDISRYDDTFYASNSFGDRLEVSYEGFNIICIDVINLNR